MGNGATNSMQAFVECAELTGSMYAPEFLGVFTYLPGI